MSVRVRIEFRASPIHGTGGFALESIPAGGRVLEYQGRRITKAESLRQCQASNPFLFCLDAEFDLDGDVADNPARFLNHSCAPNCEAELIDGKVWIVALRLILPGEELTFDYGYDLVEFREHPCHCRQSGCVGYIVGEPFRSLLTARPVVSNILP